MSDGFPRETIEFLADLRAHNDKAWFDAHRDTYDEFFMRPAQAFVDALGARFAADGYQGEPKINRSIRRIQRDTRFSKDKTPYKDHLDLMWWIGDYRADGARPVLFFRLKSDELGVGGGMHAFEKPLLERYRKAVLDDRDGAALGKVLDGCRRDGLTVEGATYARVPKGLPADHPRADLLRHTSLWAHKTAALPPSLHSAAFVDHVEKAFRQCLPLNAWLDRLATAV